MMTVSKPYTKMTVKPSAKIGDQNTTSWVTKTIIKSVAPLRRSDCGLITEIVEWLYCADH